MAMRWRRTGELLCAAKHTAKPGDTYIDDRLHYQLSIEAHAILPALDEEETGRWYWICDYPAKELRAGVQPDAPAESECIFPSCHACATRTSCHQPKLGTPAQSEALKAIGQDIVELNRHRARAGSPVGAEEE